MLIKGISKALLWRGAIALCAGALLVREALEPATPILVGVSTGKAVDHPAFSARAATRGVPLYPAISLHPVFEPSRQPWRAPAIEAQHAFPAAVQTAVLPPQGYTLTGLVMGVHQRWAILRSSFGKTVFLTEGQLWAGWRVKRIDTHGVQLKTGDAHFELSMPKAHIVVER